jgi:RNA polymerase sigma factor (TIGR02999 family)
VHEAYLRIEANDSQWNDRKHFLRAAAAVMRHLLVDHACERAAAKRGDGEAAVLLDQVKTAGDDDMMAVLALDNAIKDIAAIAPRREQKVECRYFVGLSVTETADNAFCCASPTSLSRAILVR